MFGFVGLLCAAQLRLGAPFADGAVLQRGMKVPVWGTATAGASISVSFAGQSVSTTAETNGVWHPAKIVNFRTAKNAQGQTYPTEYIDESRIVLKSDKVAAPVKARFMALPRTASTLYNEASLPLGAFETK